MSAFEMRRRAVLDVQYLGRHVKCQPTDQVESSFQMSSARRAHLLVRQSTKQQNSVHVWAVQAARLLWPYNSNLSICKLRTVRLNN